jgi:hypothetical protein
MFNATFNNISDISWRSVLLVEETGVPGENRPVASHRETLSHNIVSSTPRLGGIWTHNVSGDRHWLHRYYKIQLPYDHGHDEPNLYSTLYSSIVGYITLKYADRILKSLDINNGVFVMHLSFLAYTQNMHIQSYDMV